ncbi:uncharacterized protein BDR25DRAFT_387165 [Lindgomyces ingoldianus]|uniref:Uncharacterized protein n=1 Tax=Lindgomyces ingoldianus TaxID=673940 RepID=A0ACB6R1V7_9PLEO|nr:uncharacterized protein BDR25DRAFT_387165 [Lindgomyces ingoldianus]KAF2473070.1 hypothetical protein BDR25DRAFT_387165 [Lindgomyces ingoldianus]
MPTIETSTHYTLTNALLGPSRALASASNNDSIIIVDVSTRSDSYDQQWYFTETNNSNRYRLHTVQKGDFHAVDVFSYTGKNSLDVHFFSTGNYTGQYWQIDEWDGGSKRISNDFTGPDIHLGVLNDTLEVKLAGGDNPGQHWMLNRFGAMSTASSSTTPTAVATTLVTATTTITAKPSICTSTGSLCTSTAAPTASPSKTLAKGTLAGVVVGVVAGAILLAIIVHLLWSKRKANYEPVNLPNPSQPMVPLDN